MEPITITDKAAGQIKQILADAPEGAMGLRLNITKTGCSGNRYEMEFIQDGEDLSGDDKFEQGDVALHIPKVHSWMLFGTSVDYASDGLGNSRFVFTNPNETGRCGCGNSFQVDVEELQNMQDQVSGLSE